jgi:flagellar protein FlaG
MALDISSIQHQAPLAHEATRSGLSPAQAQAQAQALAAATEDLRALAGDLGVGTAPNRRLSFSMNSKLDEVVVKVIDTDTDKVVREIPPVELQHVYERIREVVGLLFDRQA